MSETFERTTDRATLLRQREEAALRAIYPRLIAVAHRVLHLRGVRDFEAGDLCQEGLLLAVRCLYRSADQELDELASDALAAILYTIASKAMNDRVVDHIRQVSRRRRRQHLVPGGEDIDRSFEAGCEARDTLNDMMVRAPEPGRRVLQVAVELGDVDIALIMERTGFSRAYVYRLLGKLAKTGQEP